MGAVQGSLNCAAPLKYCQLLQGGSDVCTRTALKRINWASYKINQSTDKVGVFVSICSTRIPYKGAGKEYIGEGLPSTSRIICLNIVQPARRNLPARSRHCMACRGDTLVSDPPAESTSGLSTWTATVQPASSILPHRGSYCGLPA